MKLPWLAIPLLIFGATTAWAADDGDSLTALPWSGAQLKFSGKEKKAEAALHSFFGKGWMLHVRASGPLDEDSREAAFLDSNKLASGIAANVFLEWSNGWEQLASGDEQVLQKDEEGWCSTQQKTCAADSRLEAYGALFDAEANLDSLCVKAGVQAGACNLGEVEKQVCSKLQLMDCTAKKIDEKLKEKSSSFKKAREACDVIAACSIDNIKTYLDLHDDASDSEVLDAMAAKDPKYSPLIAKARVERAERRRRLSVPYDTVTSIGLELSGSYDQLEVFRDDVAKDSTHAEKYSAGVGVVLRQFVGSNFAVTLRPGIELTGKPKTVKAERCEVLDSSSSDISAKACDSVLFLKKPGKRTYGGYVRSAAIYLLTDAAFGSVIPGVESALDFDSLSPGSSPVMNFKFAVFVAPEAKVLTARSGLGFLYSRDISRDGDETFTPFVFIAATFDALRANE